MRDEKKEEMMRQVFEKKEAREGAWRRARKVVLIGFSVEKLGGVGRSFFPLHCSSHSLGSAG